MYRSSTFTFSFRDVYLFGFNIKQDITLELRYSTGWKMIEGEDTQDIDIIIKA